jgi:hypothetical protein
VGRQGEWSVAQEHTATAVTEAAVSALWVMTARRQLSGGPRVAVACAEGEWHALPPRMAAALAAEAGADITVLGPSMPADHLQRRLEMGDIDVLALSCTVPANLIGAARCVAAAHAAGLPVVVGGPAFAGRPQRAAAIGADLLADSPQQLSEPPPAAGADVVVPEEALRLDAAPDTLVDDLLSRVLAAATRARRPALKAPHPRGRAMARALRRCAVLTNDPTVLDDPPRLAAELSTDGSRTRSCWTRPTWSPAASSRWARVARRCCAAPLAAPARRRSTDRREGAPSRPPHACNGRRAVASRCGLSPTTDIRPDGRRRRQGAEHDLEKRRERPNVFELPAR